MRSRTLQAVGHRLDKVLPKNASFLQHWMVREKVQKELEQSKSDIEDCVSEFKVISVLCS